MLSYVKSWHWNLKCLNVVNITVFFNYTFIQRTTKENIPQYTQKERQRTEIQVKSNLHIGARICRKALQCEHTPTQSKGRQETDIRTLVQCILQKVIASFPSWLLGIRCPSCFLTKSAFRDTTLSKLCVNQLLCNFMPTYPSRETELLKEPSHIFLYDQVLIRFFS